MPDFSRERGEAAPASPAVPGRAFVELGEIDVPSGVLVVLDPAYVNEWHHDGDQAADAGQVDLGTLGTAVIDGLPTDRPLSVVGVPMPEGEFAGRWRSVDIVVDPEATVVDSQPIDGVVVDSGQMLCTDLAALRAFSVDAGDVYGRITDGAGSAETGSVTLSLGGAKVCGFSNRWGDGMFPVIRDRDALGRAVRVRLDVGNEDSQRLMRFVMLNYGGATVSGLVWDGGHPPRFIERHEPRDEADSGWYLFSGAEADADIDDSASFQVVRVHEVTARFPEFRTVMEAAPGSLFHLQDGVFLSDRPDGDGAAGVS